MIKQIILISDDKSNMKIKPQHIARLVPENDFKVDNVRIIESDDIKVLILELENFSSLSPLNKRNNKDNKNNMNKIDYLLVISIVSFVFVVIFSIKSIIN
ncbi:hypothetical protein K8M07_04905 [Schnuerera sp. xch1]|uniref:hypothetical protein n=1 Tax=Schnuerera sp. xch1 TaxID=2874283 RepID=UPI001CBB6523|nr:hypothetical protein [Schnuerera sp. xch1]MBZ2174582.1 hypothetical protein [Schnuerera sp. xch1]